MAAGHGETKRNPAYHPATLTLVKLQGMMCGEFIPGMHIGLSSTA
jgi:hypothetical protein